MTEAETSRGEEITSRVYGETFCLYDEAELEAYIPPLVERIKKNGIDTALFRGARCLDAGCGIGRASILLKRLGAKTVHGVDLSELNVETCRRWAEHYRLEGLSFDRAALYHLPFADATFDIVWCNGVLMHTEKPDASLVELARVLRPGGYLWLYVYGTGGVYWRTIDRIRRWVAPIGLDRTLALLRLLMPVRRTAEFIDDWFVPRIRRYLAVDVVARLRSLGFNAERPLARGTVYDTSERIYRFGAAEKALLGEGDLRFFVRKERPPSEAPPLPDIDGMGSLRPIEREVDRLDPSLDEIEGVLAGAAPFFAVVAGAALQLRVRRRLETDSPFDLAGYISDLAEVASLLKIAR